MPTRREILRLGAGAAAAAAAGGVGVVVNRARPGDALDVHEATVEEARAALRAITDGREWLCPDRSDCSGNTPYRIEARRSNAERLLADDSLIRVVAKRGDRFAVYMAARQSVFRSVPRVPQGRRGRLPSSVRTQDLHMLTSEDAHFGAALSPADLSRVLRASHIFMLTLAQNRGSTHHSYWHPGPVPQFSFESWSWADVEGIEVSPTRSDSGITGWDVTGPISAWLAAYAPA